MKAKYSKTTGGVYPVSVVKDFPVDALDIPDALYARFQNAEISRLDVVDGVVVEFVHDQPTLEEAFIAASESIRQALQRSIDEKAKSLNFSNGNSLMLYAGFVNPFQVLAQVFATWEASVWVEASTYQALIISGTKPMPSPAEAVAMMPIYPV